MMKKEWPELLGTPEAAEVAAPTFDLMEFLRKRLRKAKKLEQRFKKPLGKVAYHAACHLRAQKIGIPGARVLGRVPGHRGRHGRAVLRGRRHLGHEGAVLRDRAASTRRSSCAASRTETTTPWRAIARCPACASRKELASCAAPDRVAQPRVRLAWSRCRGGEPSARTGSQEMP